jgi:hypothetical protein
VLRTPVLRILRENGFGTASALAKKDNPMKLPLLTVAPLSALLLAGNARADEPVVATADEHTATFTIAPQLLLTKDQAGFGVHGTF